MIKITSISLATHFLIFVINNLNDSNMTKISFDSLPQVVHELTSKIDNITMLLQSAKPEIKLNNPLPSKEAAKFLNISLSTLYTKVNKKEIPYMKLGGKLYFLREELIAHIKSGKILSDKEIEEQTLNLSSNSKK